MQSKFCPKGTRKASQHCQYPLGPQVQSYWYKTGTQKYSQKKIQTSLLDMNISLSKKQTGNSVQFSHSVVSDSLQPHGLQHTRPPCPSPTPRVNSNSCRLSQWCHPTISSSVIPFSSCPQPFPVSGSFQMSQLFTWSGQSIRGSASTSVLSMNTQDWSHLGWTSWTSLHSKGLSRVFSNTTVQKHQFFWWIRSLQTRRR